MKNYVTVLLLITVVASNPTGAGRSDEKDEKKSVADEFETGASEHSGYPQLFTRKTTRLLSEALHMLNRVKDVKERRWLEAFVHRLESLSSELDNKATAKVSANGTTKDLVAFSKSLAENTDQLKEFAVRGAMENDNSEDLNKEVSVGVAPKASEIYRDELESQLRSQPATEPRHHLKEALKTNKTPKGDDEDDEREKTLALHHENKLKTEKMKEAEKKKILKEIYALSQKLKELGGETKAVLDVIKRSRGGVQIGTGHHFWEGAHHQSRATTGHAKIVSGEDSVTSAPSNSQLREADNVPATKTTVSLVVPKEERRSSRINSSSDEEDDSEEASLDDNNDDLEKQLQEEKLILDSPQGMETAVSDDQDGQDESKRRNHREE